MHAVTLGQGSPGPRCPRAYVPLTPSLKGRNQPLYAGSSSFSRTIENQGRAASASEGVSSCCRRGCNIPAGVVGRAVCDASPFTMFRYTPACGNRARSDGCSQPAWRSGRDSQQPKQPLRAEAVDGADLQKCVVGSIAFTCFACSRSIPSQSIGFCCAQTARPFDQSIETTPATDPTRMQAPADRPKRQCCATPPMRSQLHAHTPLGQERGLHQAAVVARLDDRARCQVEGGLPAGQQVGRVGGGCCASKPCQCGQPGRRQSSSTSGWPCSHPHLVPRPKTDPPGLSQAGLLRPPPPVRCVGGTDHALPIRLHPSHARFFCRREEDPTFAETDTCDVTAGALAHRPARTPQQ